MRMHFLTLSSLIFCVLCVPFSFSLTLLKMSHELLKDVRLKRGVSVCLQRAWIGRFCLSFQLILKCLCQCCGLSVCSLEYCMLQSGCAAYLKGICFIGWICEYLDFSRTENLSALQHDFLFASFIGFNLWLDSKNKNNFQDTKRVNIRLFYLQLLFV